jgi:DHA3 family macrolide efflux protein-like MFS transporter
MENTPNTSQVPEKWGPRFFAFWSGQVVSLVGSSLVQFSLIWWLTRTTGSATVLATATLIATLPEIFLLPFSGALVDRWNRKTVIIVADSLIAFATLALMFLFATERESIWAVYAILFIRTAGATFHYPAESASIALMVPKEHLARVAGLNQTMSGILGIVAPPLGALLIGLLPMQGVLAIDVGTAIIAVSILTFIAIPRPPCQLAQADGTTSKTSYWQDLRAGWKYMTAWPGLMGVILLAMGINFVMTPASSLSPLVVTQEYHGGVMQLGLVNSFLGVGVILGGLALSAWGGFKKRIHTCMLGIAGIGAGILIYGLMPSNIFPVAVGGIFLLGFMQAMANGPMDAILQATVDPDMQGRVLSLLIAGARAMAPFSLLVAGPVSDWLGVRTWYLIGGSMCILMAVAALFIPAIMNIEENQKKNQPKIQPE